MEKIDKDLKEIGDVLVSGIKTAIEQFANGWQLTDLFAFVPVLSQIPAAITDAKNALNYLIGMTDEREAALIDYVTAQVGEEHREAVKLHIDAITSPYMLVKYYKAKADAKAESGE